MSAYAGGILISTWSSALCRGKTFITMFASAVREKQMPMGIFIALNCPQFAWAILGAFKDSSHTFALISQKRAAVEVAKEHTDPCHCRTDICHTFECLLHWSITGSPPNPLYKMFKTHFTSARCTCSWNCRFDCFRCFLRRFRRCSDDCTLGRCLNLWCLNSTKIKRWSNDSTL